MQIQLVHRHTGEIRTVPANELKIAKRLGVRAKVLAEAERARLNCFLTLTLNPDKIAFGVCPICFIRVVWDRFLKRLNRAAGKTISFISIVEKGDSVVHLHALVNASIRLAWIRQAWTDCGGGFIVSQKMIALHDEIKHVAAYITKNYVESPLTGRLLTASRDIDLEPSKDKSSWEILPPEKVIDTEISWQDENEDWEAPPLQLCAHGYFVDYLITYIKSFFRKPPASDAPTNIVNDAPPPPLDSFIITDRPSSQT